MTASASVAVLLVGAALAAMMEAGHLRLVVAGALVAAAMLSCGTAAASEPGVWLTHSLERVAQDEPLRDVDRLEICAARGETESCQMIVSAPEGGLSNVAVRSGEFVGPDGRVISSDHVSLYREHYVRVSHGSPKHGGSNEPSGPGMYPDALIPFCDPNSGEALSGAELTAVPFDLEAGASQPIWIDVAVPRSAAPGTYRGTVTVTSDQGMAKAEVSLKVWDFELPLKPSLYTAFGLRQNDDLAAAEELLRHKVMPYRVPAGSERELIDTWGLNCTNLGFSSGAYYRHREMKPPPPVAEIRERAAGHERDLLLYNYTADEIGGSPELYDRIQEYARNLHAAGVPNLITITPVPELTDDGTGTGRSAVDIWVLLPEMHESAPERVAEVLAKGDAVWSYTALVQDDHSPKWEIDFAPINYRMLHGFINQSLGFTGYLYWATDLRSEDDPWGEVPVYGLNDARYEPYTYPGEGHLVYPGEQVGVAGVVASMRLKWVRDGVDDYEYVEALKRLGRGDEALEICRRVGRDWRHWTKSPGELEAARRQLGEAIEKATRAFPPPGPEDG
jgi:hypothetical protein